MRTILAIGAHFDDIEIGIGGTLFRHIDSGDTVYLAVLYSDEFRTGNVNDRLLEQYESMKLLDIPKNFLVVMTSNDNHPDIVHKLDRISPDVIYVPYEYDTHQDHQRCSRVGRSVGRKSHITTLFYGGASVQNFHPIVFINIDFDKKLDLLNCYKSQIQRGAINIDRIEKREHYWGTMISNKECYAEGFMVHKMEIII